MQADTLTGDEMSYCRFGPDSDIYLYPSANSDGEKVFALNVGRVGLPRDGDHQLLWSEAECIAVLYGLAKEGYKVPDYAFRRLGRELMEAR
jgi:hypothetical protein